jgi:hypothetical protein
MRLLVVLIGSPLQFLLLGSTSQIEMRRIFLVCMEEIAK